MGKMRELRVESHGWTSIVYRILTGVICVCVALLVMLLVPLYMGAAFVHVWAYFAVGGTLLTAIAGLLIPFVHNRNLSRMAKMVLTVLAGTVAFFVLTITITIAQVYMTYYPSPIAYLDTPDGKYQVVLMQNTTMADDGVEYPVLTAYPMLNRFFFLMTDSEQAYIEGLKNVHWKSEWIDDRCLKVTLTDVDEGDHLSLKIDLADYLNAE
jgi:uncharacterized protein (DUF697 family)